MSFSDIREVNYRKQIIYPFAFHHIMDLKLVIIEYYLFFLGFLAKLQPLFPHIC